MKRLAIVLVMFFLATTAFAVEDKGAPSVRKEKDSTGREWTLKEWSESEGRPYPKNLKEREAWYQAKNGENWSGPKSICRILSPGNWQWEVVVTVPPDLAKKIEAKHKNIHSPTRQRIWGDRFWGEAFVWAPGGRDVTDIYALADNGVIHFDPRSRKQIFVGTPLESGFVDGINDKARFVPGPKVTMDPVTGRLYFIQSDGNREVLRYLEKLLPFKSGKTGKIYYLPAVLDWDGLYRKVKGPDGGDLTSYGEKDAAAEPVFVVRSLPGLKALTIPGPYLTGWRPLITPDGKGAYFYESGRPDFETLYEYSSLYDLETGEKIKPLKIKDKVPKNFKGGSDGPGSHGGNCVGYDSVIYNSQHGGCCGPCRGGAGRMFSIDPSTGKLTLLYDSMPEDESTWSKRHEWQPYPFIDGPADATTLLFTSTLYQAQCPRSGAIYNGGWDYSGIRRYHDGFVTSLLDNDEEHGRIGRPGWNGSPILYHGNSNPAIAPNGDLYIADDNSRDPRIVRFYRTDWPKEQPVNGYAERFLPREKLELLMLEYAQKYIDNFSETNRLLEKTQ
jgi:hypothetical protein